MKKARKAGDGGLELTEGPSVGVPGETLLTFSGVAQFLERMAGVGSGGSPKRTSLSKFLLVSIRSYDAVW